MKICILNSSYQHSDSVFKTLNPLYDPTPYLVQHEWERYWLSKETVFHEIEFLVTKGFDVFFNLCDGAADQDIAGKEVVEVLTYFGVAYTGATPNDYEPSRQAMKNACQRASLHYPKGVLIQDMETIDEVVALLQFPLIVKHPNSYNSIGLTKNSKVFDKYSLQQAVYQIIKQFGAALVEEFIEGREFTVLVVENSKKHQPPLTFSPVEFVFPPDEDFKHFDLKWKDYTQMQCVPCADAALSALLQEQTCHFFEALGGTGYGRADIRVTSQQEIYFLEMNPNCSLYYDATQAGSADFILLQTVNGHQIFTDLLLEVAKKRREK